MTEKKKIFAVYFENLHLKVYHYILKKIQNPADAEDLMMESFAACWQKYELFDPCKASFETWLFVVVCNRIKNYYRDKKTAELLDEFFPDEMNLEDDVLTAIHLSQLRDRLADALWELPEQQRKMILYRYFGNKNAREIADIMGMSHSNVRAQLSRTLTRLKKMLE